MVMIVLDEGEDWYIELTWRRWIRHYPRCVKDRGRFYKCKFSGYIKTELEDDEFWGTEWHETTLAAIKKDETENAYINANETLHMDNLL